MVGTFPSIRIRILIAMYFFITMGIAIIYHVTKIDIQLHYLLENLILLFWFAWVVKCNVNISDAYTDFKQKIIAGKRGLLLLLLFNILFAIGFGEILGYIVYQIAPGFLKDYITDEMEFEKTSSMLSAVCLYLNVCIVAPIVEEIMFRGIIFNRLMIRWGLKVGIYTSSVVFAIPHFEMVHAFIFGILMSLLYLKTNNIMVPIIFHIINNTLATMSDLITGSGNDYNFYDLDLFIGVVLFVPSVIYLVKYIKQNWPRENVKAITVD